MNLLPLKAITYRGGLICFRIPKTWVEEYGEKGSGTFYEDLPDSGTLRLEILAFRSSSEFSSESFVQSLKAPFLLLPNGNALSAYSRKVQEKGEDLLIYYWELKNPVPPKHIRLALFSYTILASQAEGSKFKQEIELLDREIKQASFSSEIGV